MVTRAAELAADYEIVDVDLDHVKAVAFNMLFMVWRRRTLAPAYRRSIEIVRDLAVRNRSGVGVLQVVEVDAIPPEADARDAFRDLLAQPDIAAFSVTHEGTGFKAAAVRAIVSATQSLVRPKFPHAVHSSLGAAAAWHASVQRSLGRNESAAVIQRIAQDLRDFHLERYPA